MRKTVLWLAAVGLILGLSLGNAAAQDATWTFDNAQPGTLPAEFIVKKGTPVVAEDPVLGQKAVRLVKSDDGVDGFIIPLPEVADRAVVEFSVYVPMQERSLVVIMGPREEGATALPTNQGVYLSFMPGGSLSYYSGGWGELGTFSTSAWNHLRIEVDVPFETFTVYLNGKKLGIGNFRGSVDLINAIEFSMFDRAGNGTVWVGAGSMELVK